MNSSANFFPESVNASCTARDVPRATLLDGQGSRPDLLTVPQLLEVRHVRPGPHELTDAPGSLAWAAVLLMLGAALRRQRRDA